MPEGSYMPGMGELMKAIFGNTSPTPGPPYVHTHTWPELPDDEDDDLDDDTCDICGDDTSDGTGSHYHCGNCEAITGMFGHFNPDTDQFTCQPACWEGD